MTVWMDISDDDVDGEGKDEIEKVWSCMLCVLGRSLAGILINNKAEVPRLSQEGKG